MSNETENQTRLRRAKEALAFCQAAEVEARKALASATESTKRAREKYEELFMAEENAERARRKNNYDHCTA
jgi:hypothetical protein